MARMLLFTALVITAAGMGFSKSGVSRWRSALPMIWL